MKATRRGLLAGLAAAVPALLSFKMFEQSVMAEVGVTSPTALTPAAPLPVEVSRPVYIVSRRTFPTRAADGAHEGPWRQHGVFWSLPEAQRSARLAFHRWCNREFGFYRFTDCFSDGYALRYSADFVERAKKLDTWVVRVLGRIQDGGETVRWWQDRRPGHLWRDDLRENRWIEHSLRHAFDELDDGDELVELFTTFPVDIVKVEQFSIPRGVTQMPTQPATAEVWLVKQSGFYGPGDECDGWWLTRESEHTAEIRGIYTDKATAEAAEVEAWRFWFGSCFRFEMFFEAYAASRHADTATQQRYLATIDSLLQFVAAAYSLGGCDPRFVNDFQDCCASGVAKAKQMQWLHPESHWIQEVFNEGFEESLALCVRELHDKRLRELLATFPARPVWTEKYDPSKPGV